MDYLLEDWKSSLASIATTLLDGNPTAILLALVVTLTLPILLHWIIYRKAASPPLSTFVLLGPSGAGKTAFLSLVESSSLYKAKTPSHSTHTSQTSTSTTVTLPPSVPIFSNRYRSVNDPSLPDAKRNAVKYVLRDTPGHGKLRSAQLTQLQTELSSKSKKEASSICGIIFFVDAASLVEGAENLRDYAGYLYDILLVLQKIVLSKGKLSKKAGTNFPILVAANKQDLFTALPPGSVKQKLESEIDRIRQTRQKGLLDASANPEHDEDGEEVLGGDGDKFTFHGLEDDIGVKVDVVGGFAKAENEKDGVSATGIRKWEEWIGSCL
ncbi:SRP receptor beta subunit (Srp102), putative [Talaromyces stipitatus ATCC 10500]|uniref:Signal recognition particle receptor subunit beta n=1 Tax=Talaromyces stipitatus (strain ATCC 10500 / CBS 375.48 / QM 6759 / NRRL 1006) TaxID=441959 RepID=B8M102_TALSN|nr:SRP receptor beta subunit (Srp102), putative [Talaromyces stipitatus ATCC 10500]EED21782.1 SRP receptor beta subunit (Srp102), putative [Talaromyces stipitatus ATCC 10500]